ncbi:MAG TPA: phosphatidylglycerophosphatase A [Vicinamibacterales bacterium]|nr:phosphatidylglycerophosphatase A [Vicinamibacterales bacterium]
MKAVALFIATGAGSGYAPVAPGTFGSVVGLIIYFLTWRWPASWQAVLLAVISLVGIWASTVAERHFGREDPGQVVIDEVAGQLLTLFLLGVGPVWAIVGFLIFRVLDVIKPWPARQLEVLPSGLGIMADDLMVGVYGWIIMRVLLGVAARVF